MSYRQGFTKENLDGYLNKLAKEFRKRNGTKMPAEIILIGGASILVNYGFRDVTYDIDAVIRASASMKEAINTVGDELGLPNGWLNTDFMKTKSYSPRLLQYSKYYKRFGYILEVRTISAEYLVAMKLMSGRPYKNDILDIVGIFLGEKQKGNELTFEKIEKAVVDLYDGWDKLPKDSRAVLQEIIAGNQLEKLYEQYRTNEIEAKALLVDFEKNYRDTLTESNVNDVLEALRRKKQQEK